MLKWDFTIVCEQGNFLFRLFKICAAFPDKAYALFKFGKRFLQRECLPSSLRRILSSSDIFSLKFIYYPPILLVARFSYTMIQCTGWMFQGIRGETNCLSFVIAAVADRRREMPLATLTAIHGVVGSLTFRVYVLMWAAERHANFISARSASVPVKSKEPFNKRLFFLSFFLIPISGVPYHFPGFFLVHKYLAGF